MRYVDNRKQTKNNNNHNKRSFSETQVRDSRLILLYQGLKGKASLPTDDLIPLVKRCRNYRSMACHVLIANTDIYKCSCFPRPLGIAIHFQDDRANLIAHLEMNVYVYFVIS